MVVREPHPLPGYLRYCSSLTFSIHSTALPSFSSWTARCVMEVVGAAPCQCFSPGANETTSPGLTSSIVGAQARACEILGVDRDPLFAAQKEVEQIPATSPLANLIKAQGWIPPQP